MAGRPEAGSAARGHPGRIGASVLPRPDRTIVLRNAISRGCVDRGGRRSRSRAVPAAGASAGAIRVAPQDAEELSDILSVGSRVIVRR